MKEIKIKIDEKKLEKIEKYTEEERFEDKSEFFNKAAKLLLYAEDKKSDFQNIIQKNSSTRKS